jgi:hypothetical protein
MANVEVDRPKVRHRLTMGQRVTLSRVKRVTLLKIPKMKRVLKT